MDFEKAFPDTLELETPRILMRKIREEDIPVFQHLGADRELWKYFKYDLSSPRKMEWYIRDALEQKKKRQRMPFTIIDKDTKEICGTSSFGNISFEDGRLEIGWSFLGKAFQGTGRARNYWNSWILHTASRRFFHKPSQNDRRMPLTPNKVNWDRRMFLR